MPMTFIMHMYILNIFLVILLCQESALVSKSLPEDSFCR